MKKDIIQCCIFLLLLISYIPEANAQKLCCKQKKQDITHIQLEYDYREGKFNDFPRFIPEGSIVSLRYTHINPFACKSEVSFESIDYKYTDGSETVATLGGLAKIAQEESAKANANYKMTMKGLNTTDELTELLNDRDQALTEFNIHLTIVSGTVNKVHSIMSLDGTLQLAQSNLTLTNSDLMAEALAANMSDEIKEAVKDGTLKQYFIDRATEINAGTAEMKKCIIALNSIHEKLLAVYPTYAFADELKRMRTITDDLYEAYHGKSYETLEKNVSTIASNLQAAYTSTFTINGNKTAVASEDLLLFGDKITDKEGKVLETHANITLYTYKGWRLNTSIGIATTFGDVNGSEYNLKKNPTGSTNPADTGVVILEESSKNRKAAFNPVLFFHYYPTLRSFISWRAVSIGVSPDFSDLNKSKLYIGTGIGFTPSASKTINVVSRIGLDAGVVLGYADVLKSKYQGYSDYAQFANLSSEDLVDRTVKAGFYFSISFNLAPVKKEDKSEAE